MLLKSCGSAKYSFFNFTVGVSVLAGSALAASVCKKITGRLTSAIAKQEDVSVQLEALDIMADMLCRYVSMAVANAKLRSVC